MNNHELPATIRLKFSSLVQWNRFSCFLRHFDRLFLLQPYSYSHYRNRDSLQSRLIWNQASANSWTVRKSPPLRRRSSIDYNLKKLLSDELQMKDWSPFKKDEIGENARLLNLKLITRPRPIGGKTHVFKMPATYPKVPDDLYFGYSGHFRPYFNGYLRDRSLFQASDLNGSFQGIQILTRHLHKSLFPFDRKNLFRRPFSWKLPKEKISKVNEILSLEGLKISRNWLKLDAQIIEKLALVTGIIWWIGRSIYFQKNHFQIFCQHKISTEKFKCIWSIVTWWRTNFCRINFLTIIIQSFYDTQWKFTSHLYDSFYLRGTKLGSVNINTP